MPTASSTIIYLAHPVRALGPYTQEANLAAFENCYSTLRPIAIDRNANILAPWEQDVRTGQDEALTMVAVTKLIPWCHELWFVTYEEQEHTVSRGVDAEIEIALKHGIPCTHWRMTMRGRVLTEKKMAALAQPRIFVSGNEVAP